MLALLLRTPGLNAVHGASSVRLDRAILPFAVTLLASNFAAAALMPTSRLLLGVFESVEQVGVFNAAAVIAVQTSLVLTGANKAFAPIVAELHTARDRAALALAYKRMTKWVGVATLPLCLLMVVFASDLLHLFGEEFAQGASLLIVLVAGQFVNAATGSVGVVLNMTGRHRLEFYNRWAMLLLAVVANLVLIPAYGAAGAAVGTTLAVIAVNVARVLEVYVLEEMQPLSASLVKTMVIAGVLLVAALLIERSGLQAIPWPVAALGIAALYGVAVLLWCLDPEDRLVVSGVIARVRRRI
jgi:O-antigen/teichoic acid export membrane protein